LDRGDGSHGIHRLDLRSLAATCRRVEGGAPADATGHCGGEKDGTALQPDLAMLYDKEKQKGNANRATLAVARKLVAYLMAVDRGQRNFQVAETSNYIAA